MIKFYLGLIWKGWSEWRSFIVFCQAKNFSFTPPLPLYEGANHFPLHYFPFALSQLECIYQLYFKLKYYLFHKFDYWKKSNEGKPFQGVLSLSGTIDPKAYDCTQSVQSGNRENCYIL